jgi:malate dehydrogenase
MSDSPLKYGLAAGVGALATGIALTLSGSTGEDYSSTSSSKIFKSHASKHITVFVSGAAGQIGYSLLPLLCSGQVFGPNTQITLNLLDITPALPVLSGVLMELEDGAYPLLRGVQITDKPEEALKGADVAIFTGGMPRKQGMERKDLISANVKIFREQGQAMEKVASKACKVLVVANPANTNCFILRANAPSIPTENFTCLTRLDFNRALTQVAMKAKCKVTDIQNVTIWGNHSATQYPDAASATVRVKGEFKPAPKVIDDDSWLQSTFITTVQQRGKAVIDARKQSSAMSAAKAIGDHIRTWLVTGTEPGCTVPMGVVSDGSYGIQKGLVFSFPLHIDTPGQFKIAQGFTISEFAQKMLTATEEELKAERIDAEAALKG